MRITTVQTATTGAVGHLRTTPDGKPVCPVCGCVWPNGAEAAWSETGEAFPDGVAIVAPSWDICPCCHTEFGNEDVPDHGNSLDHVWAVLRQKWLQHVGRSADALRQVRENLGVDVQ